MLKSGIYRHKHQKEYAEGTVDCGDILLEVHETTTAFVLKLLEQPFTSKVRDARMFPFPVLG